MYFHMDIQIEDCQGILSKIIGRPIKLGGRQMTEQKLTVLKDEEKTASELILEKLADVEAELRRHPKLLRDPALELMRIRLMYDLGLISFSPP